MIFDDFEAKTKLLVPTETEKHDSVKLNITLFVTYTLQLEEIQELYSFKSKHMLSTSDFMKHYHEFRVELVTKVMEFPMNVSDEDNLRT